MTDVFVSYKRENLAAVGRLVEALRAEGIGVWWDQDIPPNAAWEATIEQALAAAKLVIVAWSPAAVASDNVKAEARWARQQGRLLQVFVEACEPPLFFGERQGVDLKHWSGDAADAAFRSVLDAIRSGLTTSSLPSSDLMADGVSVPLPLPSKPSIAVMPFANLSGDPEQEYFADGMVEEIVTALSRIKSIFVIASGSSLSFKGKAIGPREAAATLGVRYVLEGSVRKSANRVRISVKLIDTSDGAQVWAERFDDTLDDIFVLQDKVAISVAGVIEPTLLNVELRRASARPTDNLGSYDLFLRGWSLSIGVEEANELAALPFLLKAIDLDPNNGQALGLAALVHGIIFQAGWSDDLETHRRQAVVMAHRALEAAGDDAQVLALCAGAMWSADEDIQGALSLTERSLAVNPGSFWGWFWSGWLLLVAGESDLGAEHMRTSMRLDPLSPMRCYQLTAIGVTEFEHGRFAAAIAPLAQSAQLRAGYFSNYLFLAACYGHLGQTAAAQVALARLRDLLPAPTETIAARFLRNPAHRKLLLDGLALAEGSGADGADAAGVSR